MKYIILLLFVSIHAKSIAQPELRKISISPITQNLLGTTVDVSCKFYYPRNKFSVGAGFLINPPAKGVFPDAGFHNKAYAIKFFEHIVFKAGHEVDVLSRYEGKVRLFLFTELAVSKTSLKEELYSEALSNETYKNGPIYVYETNRPLANVSAIYLSVATGPGFEVPLTDKISLQARGGIPLGIIIERYKPNGYGAPLTSGVGGYMFYSFSINYEL